MEDKKRLIDVNYALQQIEAGENENGGQFQTDSSHIKDFLNVLPTVDAVEVVHGEWVHHYHDSGEPIDDKWYCSECHMCNDHRRTWYCPNCGAKMDGK